MKKKMVTVGLLAGLAAGSGAGFIMSNSTFVGASDYPAIVIPEDTDTDGTNSTTGIRPERGERLGEVLAPLVTDGTLTQAQADAVVSALLEAAPEGRGPGGHRGDHRGKRGEHLTTVATAIGIDEAALREALVDGSSIADIAAVNGVDVQVVIDALVAEAETRIAEHVANGDITQEQADERLADVESRITDMVNGVRPERPADV